MHFVKQQHVFPSSVGLLFHAILLAGFLKISVTSHRLVCTACPGVRPQGELSGVFEQCCFLSNSPSLRKSVFFKAGLFQWSGLECASTNNCTEFIGGVVENGLRSESKRMRFL